MNGPMTGGVPISSQTLGGMDDEPFNLESASKPSLTFGTLGVPQFDGIQETMFITMSEANNTVPTEVQDTETGHNTSRVREEMFDQRYYYLIQNERP